MGLGELLLTLSLKYGSDESLDFVDELYKFIAVEAYRESVRLAIEKGPFPAFDREKYIDSEFVRRLPWDVKEAIYEHGIRNVSLLSQAPTGSGGTMVGTSTGIEPWYAWEYTRNGRFGSFKRKCGLLENGGRVIVIRVTGVFHVSSGSESRRPY